MPCNCPSYTCLQIAPNVLQCGDDIVTMLLADATGTWLMRYEFNNRWYGENIDLTDGEVIEIPYVFNEFYTHTIQFYRPDQTLYEDTCFTLDTRQLMGIAPASSGGGGDSGVKMGTVEITEYTSTFEVPARRTVWVIFPGNQGLGRYTDFTQSGTTITLLFSQVPSGDIPATITYQYTEE